MDEIQALVQIGEELARLPKDRRQVALDQAASLYVRPGAGDVLYPQLAALLERAGANLDSAGVLKDGRGGPHI